MGELVFGAVVFTAPDVGGCAGGAMLKIDGRESLLRSLELFVNRDSITQITAVLLPDEAEEIKRKLSSHLMILGIRAVTAGPGLREQMAASIEKMPADVTHVILHDASRPLVSPLDVDALMEAARKSAAVALVGPVHAGLVSVDESGTLTDLRAAKSLRQLLTPWCLKRDVFEQLVKTGPMGVLSRLVPLESSPINVRVGGSADGSIARALLPLVPKPKPKASTNPFEEAQW